MISLKKLTSLALFVSLLGISASFAMSDDESDLDEKKTPITYSFEEEEKPSVSLVNNSKKKIQELQHILYPRFLLILPHLPPQDYAQLGLTSKTLHNFTQQTAVIMPYLESLTHHPSLLGIRNQEMEERFKSLDDSKAISSVASEAFERDFEAEINTLYNAIQFYQKFLKKNESLLFRALNPPQNMKPLCKLAWISTLSEGSIFPSFDKYVQALAPKLEKEKISHFKFSFWKTLKPLEQANFAPKDLFVIPEEDNEEE